VAAVRGTQFVIESEPGKQVKVAVVDGKVELKRRVPALEQVENDIVHKSEALVSLKEKVEEETIVLDANQSGYIDNKKVEAENRIIEAVVAEHVETVKEAEKLQKPLASEQPAAVGKAEKTEATEASGTVDLARQEMKTKQSLAELDIMRKDRNEVKQIVVEKAVAKEDEADVKELEKQIEQAREKQAALTVEAQTELVINTPIKGSAIYVNSRFIGYDDARLKPMADEKILVEVKLAGYETFRTEVSVPAREKRVVDAVLAENARLVINTPTPEGSVYVNGTFIGKGRVSVEPGIGKDVAVQIIARGFKKYEMTVPALKSGESRILNVEMEQEKLLDRIAWNQKIGSAILVEPVVYGNYLIATTDDGTLMAMRHSGDILWKANLKRRIEAMPLVHKDIVYVASSSGDFYSIRLDSGGIQWKQKIFGSLLFGSRPVVVNETIFLATSFGWIYAFSVSGKELWHSDLENGIYSSLAYSSGRLFVGTEDQKICCLDEKRGKVLWRFETDSRMVSSSPVIENDTLFVGCYSGTFFAIDSMKGSLKWKYKTGDSIFSTPVVRADWSVSDQMMKTSMPSGPTAAGWPGSSGPEARFELRRPCWTICSSYPAARRSMPLP
jgi:outer membrane protein assembly factor BamB